MSDRVKASLWKLAEFLAYCVCFGVLAAMLVKIVEG
jgi:hypothetical protein